MPYNLEELEDNHLSGSQKSDLGPRGSLRSFQRVHKIKTNFIILRLLFAVFICYLIVFPDIEIDWVHKQISESSFPLNQTLKRFAERLNNAALLIF